MNKEHEYWQLQRNQEVIGWDNLLRGKFAKDWRKLIREYNRKRNKIEEQIAKAHRAQEKIQEAQERERDGYWEPMRAKQRNTQEEEPPPPKKRKADVFQRVFQKIVLIIRELWLERNTD